MAVLAKFVRAFESGVFRVVEEGILLFEDRNRLAMPLFEGRLGIEQVDLARAAEAKQKDDRLRLGSKMGRLGAKEVVLGSPRDASATDRVGDFWRCAGIGRR